MKSIIIQFSLIFLLFFAQGCKKLLEENPKTIIAPTVFFTNADSYESAVKGIYKDLPLYEPMLQEMTTDIYGRPSSAYEQAMPTYQNTPQPFYYNTRQAWTPAYSIIKNANYILAYLPSANVLTESKKTALTAEARFLRAYAYFHLVQLYGDIPMPLTVASSYQSLLIPRTETATVYKQILDDLLYAETNLPPVAPISGRVYKRVATALMARVYLTMAGNPLKQSNYFADAKAKALAVINDPAFALLNDYPSVFHNTKPTSESIWEKSYITGEGGNSIQQITLTAKTINAILVPAPWYINSFSAGDSRKTWGIVENFNDRINHETLAPFFFKFADTSDVNTPGKNPANTIVSYTFPYLRLAEMYLIAAEAENEINGPTNAYTYINKIRERARNDKNNPAQVPDLAGLSQDQFRNAVLMERKWELALEGNTWFDMKRTNSFDQITLRRPESLLVPIGPYNQTWLIPDNEVVNNNIPQNPLYK